MTLYEGHVECVSAGDAELRRLRELERRVRDEALADKIAHNPRHTNHDQEWCTGCHHRFDGIEGYRRALLADLDEKGAKDDTGLE
jgi:hypothetical protein